MYGAAWSFTGYGGKQLLRFVSRTLLSYLILPDLFGVMTIVNVFILGLDLFSDIGVTPSIIQNERGDEPAFYNTAWTLQVGRGILLWLATCLVAFPVARFYDNGIYLQVLPVAGFAAAIAGFKSTKLATASRNLKIRQIMTIELVGYGCGLTVMLVWAWIQPSIWALVAHGLVQSSIETLLSHLALKGERNRFHWQKESFGEIYRFGRWIFISTALTFLNRNNDKLILGRVMSESFLGIYVTAALLSKTVEDAVTNLGYRVLFPSYAEVARTQPDRLKPMMRKTRAVLIAVSWCAALFFMFFGRYVVLIFDEQYHGAGWMLEILAMGSLVGIVTQTYDNVLVAQGRTMDNAFLLAIQVILQISAIFIGSRIGGEQGVVSAIAIAAWVMFPIKSAWLWRVKLWQPELDLPVVATAAVVVGAVLYF